MFAKSFVLWQKDIEIKQSPDHGLHFGSEAQFLIKYWQFRKNMIDCIAIGIIGGSFPKLYFRYNRPGKSAAVFSVFYLLCCIAGTENALLV